MSNPRAKKEHSRTKDARQSQAPDLPSTGKKKKNTKRYPWVVEYRAVNDPVREDRGLFRVLWRDWTIRGRYKTEAVAQEALKHFKVQYMHTLKFEYRLRNLEDE